MFHRQYATLRVYDDTASTVGIAVVVVNEVRLTEERREAVLGIAVLSLDGEAARRLPSHTLEDFRSTSKLYAGPAIVVLVHSGANRSQAHVHVAVARAVAVVVS